MDTSGVTAKRKDTSSVEVKEESSTKKHRLDVEIVFESLSGGKWRKFYDPNQMKRLTVGGLRRQNLSDKTEVKDLVTLFAVQPVDSNEKNAFLADLEEWQKEGVAKPGVGLEFVDKPLPDVLIKSKSKKRNTGAEEQKDEKTVKPKKGYPPFPEIKKATSVKTWHGFRSKAMKFQLNDPASTRFSHVRSLGFRNVLNKEDGAKTAFEALVNHNLRPVLMSLGMKADLSPDEPDLPYYTLKHPDRGVMSLTNKGGVLCPIELKPPQVFSRSQVIVRLDKEYRSGDHGGSAALDQLFEYIQLAQTRYGILSSYRTTYFVRYDGNTTYEVSRPVVCTAENPTLLRYVLYMIRLALEDEPELNKRLVLVNKISISSDKNECVVQIKGSLGHGRVGAWKGRTTSGLNVAVKFGETSFWESLVYDKLSSIQGIHIPIKVFSGRSQGGFALVCSFEGASLSSLNGDILVVLKNEAVAALQAVHNLGVLHGDVRLANFVFNESVVKVIDFEDSCASSSVQDRLEELKTLEDLFMSHDIDSSSSNGVSSPL